MKQTLYIYVLYTRGTHMISNMGGWGLFAISLTDLGRDELVWKNQGQIKDLVALEIGGGPGPTPETELKTNSAF